METRKVVTLSNVVWMLICCTACSWAQNATRDLQTGWGILEIFPNAFMSVIYRDSFRITVYKNQALDPADVQYYYSPALILDPTSATSSYSIFTGRYEMTFTVIMWDEEFEEFVRGKITEAIGRELPQSKIRVLPIEEIRLDATGHLESDYEIVNKWISYASQPSVFEFRLNCARNETCWKAATAMRFTPKSFVGDMVVYYSLRSQKITKRSIKVRSGHVQTGALYTTLNQRFPNQDTVYLKSNDLKQLTQEIANFVVATEVTDEEFVSQDQSVTISALLERVLKTQTESTARFSEHTWNSVFWHDENSRPDKVVQSLSDLYHGSNDTVKELFKDYFSNQESSNKSISAKLQLKVIFGGQASYASNRSSNSTTYRERDDFANLLENAREIVQWNGEKITPRPMQLSRVNLSGLRTPTDITTVQVRVTKTASELSSRINIMPTSSSAAQMVRQRADLHRLEKTVANLTQQLWNGNLNEVGTIAMVFSMDVPRGWLPCNGTTMRCTDVHKQLCEKIQATVTPDLRDRFPIGVGSSSAPTIGYAGGEANHTLTIDEMPSHNHNFSVQASGTAGSYYLSTTNRERVSDSQSDRNPTFHTGGGQPHNTLPPFIAVQFIIKY